jgi:hypothetical protein
MHQLTYNSFYDELDTANQKAPAHNINIILGDLRATTGHEEVFQQTMRREIFHEASNSYQLRATDFAIIYNVTENIKLQECLGREGTYIMLRK